MARYEALKGLTVKNNGIDLERVLCETVGAATIRHMGNFTFEAALASGETLTVYTEPVDEECTEIKITDVWSAPTDYLEQLAARFGIETLETRHSDSLDFHEVSVWSLRKMLEAAYEYGAAAGRAEHGKADLF